MSEQSTCWRNMCLSFLIMAALILGSAGCSHIMSANEVKIEHVRDTWTGTLTPIRLYDHAGTPYEGVALRTETGPALPTPVSESKGGGSLPILVTNTLPCRILDPI